MINLSVSCCDYTDNGDSSLVDAGYYYVFSGEPSWFIPVEIFGVVNGAFFFNPQGQGGDSFIIGVVKKLIADDSTVDSGQITVTVNICHDDYVPRCCDNVYNIAWLSPEGGWKNYLFIGKDTIGVDQDKGSDFKDVNKVLRWTEVENVYDNVIVGTGSIPKSHVDYTKSLRFAIQAYQYDSSSGTWSIPIIINRDKFAMYKRSQHFYEWILEFRYATEIIVQSQ